MIFFSRLTESKAHGIYVPQVLQLLSVVYFISRELTYPSQGSRWKPSQPDRILVEFVSVLEAEKMFNHPMTKSDAW